MPSRANLAATSLIRVVAYVIPKNNADDALLQSVKTDDVVRVRGIVQEIRLRTIVAIVPSVLSPTGKPEM